MAGEIATAYVRVRPNVAGFRQEAEGGVRTALSGIGRTAKTALAVVGGTSVAAGLLGGAKAAVDFERGLRNVNSIAHESDKTLEGIGQTMRDIGREAGESPTTLASGLYDIVSSGFAAADATKVLDVSARAAAAGLTSTATAASAIDAALNAYHLTAARATEVSDVLFQVVNKGVLTFEELAQNMGDLVPAAAPLGITLEEVGSAIATITLQGVPAAEAATRVKNTMLQLASPSKGLSKLLRENGFATGEAAVKQLGYAGVLELVTKATHGSVAETAKFFPEIRAQLGIIGLTGKNAKTYADTLDSMAEATAGVGATTRAFNEQAKSVSFQWDQSKASLESAAIVIGSLLFPAIRGASAGADSFAKSVERHRDAISDDFRAIATAVKPVGEILLEAGKGAAAFSNAVGVPTILAGVVAYKTIGVVVGLASRAKNSYVTASGRASAATGAETAAAEAEGVAVARLITATESLVVATNALTTSQGRVTVAFEASTIGANAAAGANARLAASETAAGAAGATAASGGIGSFLRTVGTMGLGVAGGPVGLAVIGLAALAAGIVYARSRATEAEKTNRALADSFRDLDSSVAGLPRAQNDLATASLSVEAARKAIHSSKATKDSIEYRTLLLTLRRAQLDLADAQKRVKATTSDQTAAFAESSKAIERLAADTRRTAAREILTTGAGDEGDASKRASDLFAEGLRKQREALGDAQPLLARNITLLEGYADAVDRVPTKREIRMIFNNKATRTSLLDVFDAIRDGIPIARVLGRKTAAAYNSGFRDWIEAHESLFNPTKKKGLKLPMLHDIGDALTHALPAVVKGSVDIGEAVMHNVAKGMSEADADLLVSLRKSLKDAKGDLADTIAQTNQDVADSIETGQKRVGDAIIAGAKSVDDAVASAQQSLSSIGSTVASGLADSIDNGPLSRMIDRLQSSIARAKSLQESEKLRTDITDAKHDLAKKRRAVNVVGTLDAEQKDEIADFLKPSKEALRDARVAWREFNTSTVLEGLTDRRDKLKTAAERDLADLVARFNAGKITLARFTRGVSAELAQAGLAPQKLFTVPGAKGVVDEGNIDLLHRKVAKLGKQIATVKSVSIETDLGETLIPQVIDGKVVSLRKAIEHFRKTGENLGTFDTIANANAYAKNLHEQQAVYYAASKQTGKSAAGGFADGWKVLEDKLGFAAVETLRANITALGDQAAASAAGPQKANAGIIPQLVKPGEVAAKANQDIVDAVTASKREISDAQDKASKAVIDAQEKVAAAAADQRKETNRILREIAAANLTLRQKQEKLIQDFLNPPTSVAGRARSGENARAIAEIARSG